MKIEEIYSIGDDVTDIPAFKAIGLPIAFMNANSQVLPYLSCQTERSGGKGTVREIVDMVLVMPLGP